MDKYVDFWNLKTYGNSWPGHNISIHQANLFASSARPLSTPFTLHNSVKYYTQASINESKINLDIPLGSQSFCGTLGPGFVFSGTGCTGKNSTLNYDASAGATYTYDADNRVMTSVEDSCSAGKKAYYVRDYNLRGVAWSYDGPWSEKVDLIERVGKILAEPTTAGPAGF